MAQVLAVLSMGAGALCTVCVLVFLLACGANASPAQSMQLKWMLIGVALVGAGCFFGAIWAVVAGLPWLGVGLGLTPIVLDITLIIVLVIIEW